MDENNQEEAVRYYTVSNPGQQPSGGKKGASKKPIFIFGGIVLAFILIAVILGWGSAAPARGGASDASEYADIHEDYIGVLYVEGEISSDDSSGVLSGSTGTYNQQWTLDCISAAQNNPYNKGLILFVNSPGGGVYESDQVYNQLLAYEKTGKPLYAAMGSMAASGGYYISAPADKIIADRNCWTGSIGVTIGTLYDFSGLLKRYGVKTVTITSGKNKAMGNYAEPLTKEQKQIFQSLVNEAYDQFVGVVAKGRKMSVAHVKKLADGRIYTAKQALKKGLIDQIGTLSAAVNGMKTRYGLEDCQVYDMQYQPKISLVDSLLGEASKVNQSSGSGDIGALGDILKQQGKLSVSYMSEIRK